MQKVLYSITITVLVSILVGFLVSNFWVGFILAFILQFVGFSLFNTLYTNYIITKVEALKVDQMKETTAQQKEANRQIVSVKCPCSMNNNQGVEFKLDQEIMYKCDKCDKNIKLHVDIKPFITTQPIYFNEPRINDDDSKSN
jgi:hypothetical protein